MWRTKSTRANPALDGYAAAILRHAREAAVRLLQTLRVAPPLPYRLTGSRLQRACRAALEAF
jgi:hypothetical protein